MAHTSSMAAVEVKLFGKWTFDDIEVRIPPGGAIMGGHARQMAHIAAGRRAPRAWTAGAMLRSPMWGMAGRWRLAGTERAAMRAGGGPGGPPASPAARAPAACGRTRPPSGQAGAPGPRSAQRSGQEARGRERARDAALPQVNDISLEDYIAVKPKYARFTAHSAGRFQKRRFRKAQCPSVER